ASFSSVIAMSPPLSKVGRSDRLILPAGVAALLQPGCNVRPNAVARPDARSRGFRNESQIPGYRRLRGSGWGQGLLRGLRGGGPDHPADVDVADRPLALLEGTDPVP